MEKDKMIEELEKDIAGIVEMQCVHEEGGLTCINCPYYQFRDKCMIVLVAEALTNKGYIKVDKDSVVLTGIDKGTMYAKVTEGSVVLTKEELESGITFNEVVKSIVRKETAKEILKLADALATGSQNDGVCIIEAIKNRFGVEVEE